MDDSEVRRHYIERQGVLVELARKLKEATNRALATSMDEGLINVDRISFRVKDLDSFCEKAGKLKDAVDPNSTRKYSDPLEEIEDQVAGRILVFFRSDLVRVEKILTERFGPVEIAHKEPKSASEFDYETNHYVFAIPTLQLPSGWGECEFMPETFEMQVRTLFMHAWAEPQHNLNYKNKVDIEREEKRRLAWVAASAWGADESMDYVYQKLSNSK